MARVTVEDCLPLVENRFALVLLSTKRTRQLMAGARPIVETVKNKPPVLALREVATGKVRFDRSVHDALAGKFDKPRHRPMMLRPVSSTGPRNILNEP
jgi:DNA-directed RNA polymerase subunit omega